MLEVPSKVGGFPGLAEKAGARLTDDQVNDQDCNHASQWDVESRADMCEVLRVGECFISGHTPGKS